MPGYLLHVGAAVQCAHAGQAKQVEPNVRVTVGGKATAVTTSQWTIAGCTLPSNAGGPCVTAQWTVGTTRVTSGNKPLVISSGAATCTPTATPLTTISSQLRVKAT